MPFELAWPSANSSAAISLTSAYRCLLSGGVVLQKSFCGMRLKFLEP